MFSCSKGQSASSKELKPPQKPMKKKGLFGRSRSSGDLISEADIESNKTKLTAAEESDESFYPEHPASPGRLSRKKKVRRPSGSFVFPWKKDLLVDDDDDEAEASMDSSITSGATPFLTKKEESLRRMEIEGEELLKTFRKDYKHQKKVCKELEETVQMHLDRAKARMDSGNTRTAVISMKRVKHYEAELDRVLQALKYVKEQEIALHNRLNEAKAFVALGKDSEGNAFSSFSMVVSSSSKLNFDLTPFRFVHDRMEQILSYDSSPLLDSTESTEFSESCSDFSLFDQELLDELAVSMQKDQAKKAQPQKLDAASPRGVPRKRLSSRRLLDVDDEIDI